jgi:general secretion pathway protein I
MMINRLWTMACGGACAVAGTASISFYRSRHGASIATRLLRKLRRPMNHAGDDAGFTLVEVIVALAMLSLGLSVLLGLISSSLRQSASAERMAEAGSLAQSLMAEVGTDLPIKLEEREGQFPNGYRWHLKMKPYGDASEREEWPVGVYTISMEVEWEDGTQRRFYALTTLRLGPKQVRQ